MPPLFTNDAVTLGLLLIILASIFYTASLESSKWKTFYSYIPSLLLCYFIPALFHWPLGLIAPHWFDPSIVTALTDAGITVPENIANFSFEQIQKFILESGLDLKPYVIDLLQESGKEIPANFSSFSPAQIQGFIEEQKLNVQPFASFERESQLYFVSSRYLLPASLILLCLSIDFKGIMRLGPKALIMFFAATLGIIIGGPIAMMIALNFFPNAFAAGPDELYRGLSTVAGSWIGGGANQTAMKEIYNVGDNLFASMIVVDVIVANIWMGFLLYGAGVTNKIDRWLKADSSAIEDLKERIQEYRGKIERIPSTKDVFMLLAIGFGGVALAHWGSDVLSPWMRGFSKTLESLNLQSLTSGFFWLIVISTTVGVAFSFTKFRKLEGVGASRMGTVFIYILVASIGMKMNLAEIGPNLGLFFIGLIWMLVHVIILLVTAKLIRAPFFFVAVGSQANVGGAASAPIVASAFSPALAPVGVLMAVLGYALGTYGAIICATLMSNVSG